MKNRNTMSFLQYVNRYDQLKKEMDILTKNFEKHYDVKDVTKESLQELRKDDVQLRYGTDVSKNTLKGFIDLCQSAMKSNNRLDSSVKWQNKNDSKITFSTTGDYRLYDLQHISQKVIADKQALELHLIIKNNQRSAYIDEWID